MSTKEAIQQHFAGNYERFYSHYLKGIRPVKGDETQALCPFHEDKNPSLSLNLKTGQFFCHGCKARGDMYHFYGRMKELDPRNDFQKILLGIAEDFHISGNGNGKRRLKKEPFVHHQLGKPSFIYNYTDETGETLFHVCRFTLQDRDKTFRQCKPGGVDWNLDGVRLVPYNLPEVLKSQWAAVVEGERDVESLRKLGCVATTNPQGAGKWRDEYSLFMKNKDVILLPDNDEPGRDHMRKVAASLHGKVKSIKWVDLPGLPEKGDVTDFIQRFGDDSDAAGERLAIMFENAEPYKGDQIERTDTEIQPLTPDQTSIVDFMDRGPPDTEYILKDLLPKGIVGGIIGMGGVSKSFFMLTIGLGAATGETVLRHFEPARPFKTLALFTEDSTDELHRRAHFTIKSLFPEFGEETRGILIQNFHAVSVMGRIGPLMRLEQNNPIKSFWFDWLRATIEAHDGLELLLLDPKSRLFGLEENSNDHNTAWIQCLEELGQEFGLTILFSHHVSKASGGAMIQTSARGGSALVDACRWVANLRTMDVGTGNKFEVGNYRQFVEFDISKNNYAPGLPRTFYFKRGEHGVLTPINLEFHRLKEKAGLLCDLLQEARDEGRNFTKRELVYRPCCKEIRESMGCKRKDLEDALDFAVKEGWITVRSLTSTGKKPKGILVPERIASDQIL